MPNWVGRELQDSATAGRQVVVSNEIGVPGRNGQMPAQRLLAGPARASGTCAESGRSRVPGQPRFHPSEWSMASVITA
jgi:hypothetical protein